MAVPCSGARYGGTSRLPLHLPRMRSGVTSWSWAPCRRTSACREAVVLATCGLRWACCRLPDGSWLITGWDGSPHSQLFHAAKRVRSYRGLRLGRTRDRSVLRLVAGRPRCCVEASLENLAAWAAVNLRRKPTPPARLRGRSPIAGPHGMQFIARCKSILIRKRFEWFSGCAWTICRNS